jgi:aspartate kinase
VNGVVVQKYGGTSVGSPERIRALAKRIARQFREGLRKNAVVVSAMSGETNRLVDLMKQVNPAASAMSYDMAVSAGEQVSVGLVAAALEGEGIRAVPLLGHQLGILTDDFHGRARIRSIQRDIIDEAWDSGAVPVVAGFQGVTAENAITTLGRGGSDTSAVALAVALEADYCEINTDVDGVYSADPRSVPEARHLARVDYETALEMASLGSKVLHPRCVELGAKYRMPLIVRSSFDPDYARRTWIMSFTPQEVLETPVVTGVTVAKDIARLTVEGFGRETPILRDLFAVVAEAGINVDVIVHDRHSEGHVQSVGFTVPAEDVAKTLAAVETLKSTPGYEGLTLSRQTGLVKVSAVGVGMRSHSGVASRAFTVLQEQGIPILMVTTSEIKISCVVAENLADKAARALHSEFC